MREYIITVSAAAIAASVAEMLAPREWSKYIRVMIGFLILAVVFAPAAKFKNAEILSPTATYEISDKPLKNRVAEELRANIEKDIEERLDEEFKIKASASAEIDVNENGEIEGVRAIRIKTWKNPDGMTERLKEIYGCDKIEIKFE